MENTGPSDETIDPWADAGPWLLIVPVALLPFVVAPIALLILKSLLLALGVSMSAIAFFLVAGISTYVSVMWAARVAPKTRWSVGGTLSATYMVVSVLTLLLVVILDHHPGNGAGENETPEIIQMLALGGLGVGAFSGYVVARRARRLGPGVDVSESRDKIAR
jgi:FtsH-binding integral membrane protein